MIQDRTLELLKNPKNIQIEDLQILEKDITKYPYMQSIRALYLYGSHLYNQNVYNELLTLTAAYTTDKKNLYQFIKQSVSNPKSVESDTPPAEIGNRIENFEEPKLESESLSVKTEQLPTSNEELKAENQTSLETIELPTASNEKPISESELPPAISFDNNSEDTLPDVKIEPIQPQISTSTYVPKPSVNKHEEEMKRLIAEVEAKMAKNRAAKKKEIPQEEIISGDINFSEYEREEQSQENTETKEPKNIETSGKEWKPLDFMPNTPDALLEKENISVSEEKQLQEETIQKNEAVIEPPKSNVPQFINTWQSWLRLEKTESVLVEHLKEIETEEPQKEEELQPEPIEEITENSKEDIKSKAIDTFIESNPKISKVNKDFTEYFTPKDKGDDISHLMTETLANLYVEQRLYTKAIQSFKILIQKYPEKKEHFKARIQEVKELRMSKNND